LILFLLLPVISVLALTVFGAEKPASFVISGARLADGTGAPLRLVDIRVLGDKISRIGKFQPPKGERVIDARGLVLAPGFIDIHNHSTDGVEHQPLAESQVAQGVTTLLLGQDGSSPWPLGKWLDERRMNPPALNVLLLVGHATVRKLVMGEDFRRMARPDEVSRMAALVEQGMREGAVGLSSGLEYVIGSYADTEEVIALARAAARYKGFYISHTRDEADRSFEAIRELLEIGRRAQIPVQNTHIKLGTAGVWNRASEVIRVFEEARKEGIDVTADCYPYDAWHSNMKVLVPSKKWDDPGDVAKGLSDIGGPGNVLVIRHDPHPEYGGKTLEEIARSRGMTPVRLYIEMVRDGDAEIIGKSMIDEDIRRFYQWPWTMVSSDGGIGMRHPRATGTFPKVLGRYVREQKWLTLEDAVRKMTSLPAGRLGLADRGTIRGGNVADLVLFNPDKVIDRSTYQDPERLPEGIEYVWVNGVLVWEKGSHTGARPGRIISSRKP
jgi:N-acyl-D-amino-acid deacylase